MYRSAPRLILRLPTPLIRNTRPQRYFSTTPRSQRSRSWKNSAIRWGLAIGGVYYYNTSNVFAEEPTFIVPPTSPTDEAPIPTLESLAPSRQPKPSASLPPTSTTPSSQEVLQNPAVEDSTPLSETEEEDSPAEGAFNEETGEINWDCPCLGGMAHGPCGEQFRTAFSCFVFSKEEPKGMECIDNFKDMQDCFRQHPEMYEESQPPETFDTEIDQPSTFNPPPARPSDPQVDEPSVYQPPSPPSSSPIYPQVDEPLRIPTEPVQTPSSNLEPASPRAEPAAPSKSPEEKKPAAVSR